jgi:hypothetical protein
VTDQGRIKPSKDTLNCVDQILGGTVKSESAEPVADVIMVFRHQGLVDNVRFDPGLSIKLYAGHVTAGADELFILLFRALNPSFDIRKSQVFHFFSPMINFFTSWHPGH